ncbi:YbeF family protein [Bacillus sp. 123MFChir2]|uniref:YbeF family protein n=1 Tax=Bacillus sp. 123MFChir2 TaxID=1169144 RepID=UPI0003727C99|nr:YbeF family protein [Bacillus sp. 123MFChir2]
MSEFIFVLFVCPLLIFILSVIGTRITKTYYVMPIITFAIFLILAVTLFNRTFFFWVGMYSIFSFLVSYITLLFEKGKKEVDKKQ